MQVPQCAQTPILLGCYFCNSGVVTYHNALQTQRMKQVFRAFLLTKNRQLNKNTSTGHTTNQSRLSLNGYAWTSVRGRAFLSCHKRFLCTLTGGCCLSCCVKRPDYHMNIVSMTNGNDPTYFIISKHFHRKSGCKAFQFGSSYNRKCPLSNDVLPTLLLQLDVKHKKLNLNSPAEEPFEIGLTSPRLSCRSSSIPEITKGKKSEFISWRTCKKNKHGPRQPRLMVAVHKATVNGLCSQIGHAPWTQ